MFRLEDLVREHKRRQLCNSFPLFRRWVFEEIHRIPYQEAPHLTILDNVVADIWAGNLVNVVINIPPRYFKTKTIVILFVAWSYAKNRGCNFIHTSFSDSLALKNSSMIKGILESDPFIKIFGPVVGQKETSKQLWSTLEDGTFRAASSRSAITGFGAGGMTPGFHGALIMDDPNKPDDIFSEVKRQAVIDNYEDTLSTRVNSIHTPKILIAQRLHTYDLSGHLLSGKSVSGKFKHICLPAIKEDNNNAYDKREVGEALFPRKHSIEELRRMEKANSVVFAGQYQQRPAPQDGHMVKEKWLKSWDIMPLGGRKIISCDLGFKKEGRSRTCFSVYLHTPDDKVLLIDQVLGHWSFDEAHAHIKLLLKKHANYHVCLIEDAANGPAIVSVLQKTFRSIIPIGTRALSKLNDSVVCCRSTNLDEFTIPRKATNTNGLQSTRNTCSLFRVENSTTKLTPSRWH